MSAHAFTEEPLVEQLAIKEHGTNGTIPTSDWCWLLIKSLQDDLCKSMFFRLFLFEWKTAR